MATTTVSVPRSSSLRIRRILGWLLVVILFGLSGICAWLYSIADSALPQLDGKARVKGISAQVTVVRDGHGFPTITAANLADLFFAQGYVTAQDRLWQMDGMRRFAAGELSEILGDGFLKHDRRQRILGIRAAARHITELTPAEDRSGLEAYARGVNA